MRDAIDWLFGAAILVVVIASGAILSAGAVSLWRHALAPVCF